MSLETLANHPVTIQSAATTTDRYNNAVLDWDSITETSSLAWIEQTDASENFGHRDGLVTNLLATFLVDKPVPSPYDRVVVDGQVYDVVGSPNPRPTPRGVHHVDVRLRAVAG